MEIFNEIENIATKTFNPYIDEARKNGAKIMAYNCSYVPEELIHAAGFIPYRLRAVESTGTSRADTYFTTTNCSFVRNCFDKALNNDFHFLDGIIFMNGCDHNRRLYDNWKYAGIKPDFIQMLPVPYTLTDLSLKKYILELKKLKEEIENYFNIKITDEALQNSIGIYNKRRKILTSISEGRKNCEISIKGSEFLTLLQSITALPVEKGNEIIENIEKEIKGRVVSSEKDIRLMIMASCFEELDHMRLIEDCGGITVADNLCLGESYYDTNIDTNGDPLAAIAERYLRHLSCSRMVDDFENRIKVMHNKIRDCKVDAVILDKLKFCTHFSGDAVIFQKELKKVNVPVLLLEREFNSEGTGQLKTRIQAFYEKICNTKN